MSLGVLCERGHGHSTSRAAGVCRLRSRKTQLIHSYKAARGCAVCGERDVVVLDLDHRDPSTKDPRLRRGKGGVRDLVQLSLVDLAAELEKCDVLCANDHRRKTAEKQDRRWKELSVTG